MARTMVIGLTESGTRTKVNEDSFSCGDRVYPDMITGSEEQTLSASDYTQAYIVTQGFGGSGAGDLAGRIIQRVSKDFVARLDDYKHPELDFNRFSRDLIRETHLRVLSQIAQRAEEPSGASFALLLIDANTAYILNVGDTRIHLCRDREFYSLIDSYDTEAASEHPVYIGDMGAPFDDPVPNTMKRFDLVTGDIVLLTSEGFHTNFHHKSLAEDIIAPDAFAANIRLAQIHSRQADNAENGTILAIKVRDLELVEPNDTAKKHIERIQKSYGSMPTNEESVAAEPRTPKRTVNHNHGAKVQEHTPPPPLKDKTPEKAPSDVKSEGDKTMLENAKKSKRKSNWKTFGMSLLVGFLIGLAVILVVWFVILQ